MTAEFSPSKPSKSEVLTDQARNKLQGEEVASACAVAFFDHLDLLRHAMRIHSLDTRIEAAKKTPFERHKMRKERDQEWKRLGIKTEEVTTRQVIGDYKKEFRDWMKLVHDLNEVHSPALSKSQAMMQTIHVLRNVAVGVYGGKAVTRQTK